MRECICEFGTYTGQIFTRNKETSRQLYSCINCDVMADMQCSRFNTGDWNEWIDNFKAFALLKGWDDTQKVVALPLFLEGSAKQVFQSLSAEQREDWTILCDTLRAILMPEDDGAEARFLQRKQMPGETVAMFAAGLRALGNVAYMEHNDVTKEKFLLRQFLKGLEIKVAEETVRQNPTTLTAAVAAAQRALQVQRSLDEIRQQPRREEPILTAHNGPSQVNAVQTRDEVNELKIMVSRLTEAVDSLMKSSRRVRIEEDERHRTHSPQPRRRSPSPALKAGPSSKSGLRCFECGKLGHFRRDCSDRNMPKSKRSEN